VNIPTRCFQVESYACTRRRISWFLLFDFVLALCPGFGFKSAPDPEPVHAQSQLGQVQSMTSGTGYDARHERVLESHRLYAQHDVFVFPSIVEGLPDVLMEAMAGGMPVITTETSGMSDIIENDFNGLLVPPADAESLGRSDPAVGERRGPAACAGDGRA
jgi:hypothetical protein